jgi:hypothetical protein
MFAASAAVAVAGFLFASGARAEELKHYDSNNKQFWTTRRMIGSWVMKPRN